MVLLQWAVQGPRTLCFISLLAFLMWGMGVKLLLFIKFVQSSHISFHG